MNKLVVIVLLAIFAACVAIVPRNGFKFPTRLPRDWLKRYAEEDDDEESDFWMALAPLAINLVKNKLMKKRDAMEEEDEESDNWLLDRVRRQFGIDPSQRVYNYDAAEEDEEEADAEFLGKVLKGIGKTALQVGKAYVGQKYGIQLDEEEDEEETDAAFFSKVAQWWKNKGKDLALKGLQIYSAVKNGGQAQAQSDEEDLADIKIGKFFGKLGKGALEVGKKYISAKYGIPLSEDASFDEEADAEFLKKIAQWWNSKGKDLAIKGLQIYSAVKNGGQAQAPADAVEEDEEDEISSDHHRFRGALKRLERASDLLQGLENAEQSDAEFLDALKNAISKVKDWLKSKFAPKKAAEEEPTPAAQA